ncbi:MAG: OsmC family protein [Chloroflexaceae bacterium]|nr:OsmC family protein [Chloroflexaceae bacterium]NJO05273.1 OsmC family protein [Chloroflexaceae bacterium]
MPTLPNYLDYKRGRLDALREHLRSTDTPAVPLAVTARVAGGSGVRPVQVREFTVVTDSSAALAGYNLGPTSPEMLLVSLASCLAHTFLIIGVQHHVTYDTLEVEVKAEIDFRGMFEMEGAAAISPYNIRYEARIASPASDDTLAAVQRDVERLCPVFLAVTQPTPVSGGIVRK